MGSHGIRDRIAIVGMGCTRFAEHWDKGLDDLLLEATGDAFAEAGVTKDDVDAYWVGTAQGGMSGMLLAKPLQLDRSDEHTSELTSLMSIAYAGFCLNKQNDHL